MESAGHAAAIEWAEYLRTARDEVCEALGSGSAELARVLEERRDPAVGAIHLLCVLEALPGARKIDTRRSLAAAGLDMRTPIGHLEEAQVSSVLGLFGAEADRPDPGAGESR